MLFVCTGKKLFCRFCLPVQVTWSFASFLSGPLLLSPQTLRSDHYPTFSRGSSYEHFNFSCSSSKSWFPESCPIVFSLSRCRFYCGYLPNPKHPKPPRVSRLHQNEKNFSKERQRCVAGNFIDHILLANRFVDTGGAPKATTPDDEP